MNSKKAQSEIITTVLIILLVLAAIIIVWQVVQSTIGKTKTGIDDNSLCLGSQLTIDKATAATGTCPYLDVDATHVCTAAMKVVARTATDNGNCPMTPSDTINCKPFTVATAFTTPSTSGIATVERTSNSGNDQNITVRIFVNSQQITAIGGPLGIYGKTQVPITGLNVSDEVKVAAILSQDGFLCPAAPSVKAINP